MQAKDFCASVSTCPTVCSYSSFLFSSLIEQFRRRKRRRIGGGRRMPQSILIPLTPSQAWSPNTQYLCCGCHWNREDNCAKLNTC